MPKRQVIGVVTSDKMREDPPRRDRRLVRHPKYGKILRRRTVCHVHDENNESHIGDTVEIDRVAAASRSSSAGSWCGSSRKSQAGGHRGDAGRGDKLAETAAAEVDQSSSG